MSDARAGSPAEQMRVSMERLCAAGLSPDVAFDRAFARVKWPHATVDRRAEKAIIRTFRSSWIAAYSGASDAAARAATGRLAVA